LNILNSHSSYTFGLHFKTAPINLLLGFGILTYPRTLKIKFQMPKFIDQIKQPSYTIVLMFKEVPDAGNKIVSYTQVHQYTTHPQYLINLCNILIK
jgi:hypothetical protein